MQGLSALQESTLYCTQPFFFASVTMCELQPRLSRAPSCATSAAPMGPCVACPIHGLLGLLLRSSGAVGSAIEVTAAQDFERPRLCYTHDASTARSALVDRAAQNVIY